MFQELCKHRLCFGAHVDFESVIEARVTGFVDSYIFHKVELEPLLGELLYHSSRAWIGKHAVDFGVEVGAKVSFRCQSDQLFIG